MARNRRRNKQTDNTAVKEDQTAENQDIVGLVTPAVPASIYQQSSSQSWPQYSATFVQAGHLPTSVTQQTGGLSASSWTDELVHNTSQPGAVNRLDAAFQQLQVQSPMNRLQYGESVSSTAYMQSNRALQSSNWRSMSNYAPSGPAPHAGLNPLANSFTNNSSKQYHHTATKFMPPRRSARLKEKSQLPTTVADAQSVQSVPVPSPAQYSLPLQFKKKFDSSKKLDLLPVPKPTDDYETKAAREPIRLTGDPQRLLVVLDLNGVCVFRHKGSSNRITSRPGLGRFLAYLFANHSVLVWSSAHTKNVRKMCDTILTEDQKSQLIGMWSRDNLELGKHIDKNVQVYKQLSWVWRDMNAVKPDKSWLWDQTNTVLIDDTDTKAKSEPYNLVEVPEFDSSNMEDTVLLRVEEYLDNRLKWQADVSRYIFFNKFETAKEDETAT